MTLTIYHNPRCSKSRQTLELLHDREIATTVVHYLDTPPDADRILEIAALLKVSVHELMRTGEAEYKDADDLPDQGDDAALAAWLQAHPKVLQRPVVVDDQRGAAVIGRPPENVFELINHD